MTNEKNNGLYLEELIQSALKTEMSKKYEELKDNFTKDLDKYKDEIISNIALNLMKEVSYQYVGDILRIEINTKKI
jgi:hypothetical protein